MCNSIGILSVLTAAGLGISYLPYGYFTDKMIKQGRLQVLDTAPGFPPFEYCAVFDERKPQPFARMIAELAQRYSTFDKMARGRARRTGRQSASRRTANIS